MKVSIVTATLNSQRTVSDTIVSIQQQSFKNIEHVIIDGASNDDTLKIIRNLGHNGPFLSEADKGMYHAMNKGIKLSTGDIIGILNSDDFYAHNHVIQKVVNIFETHACDAIYGDLIYIDPVNRNKLLRKWIAGGYTNKLFYRGWMPPHPTFFVRKEVYENYGLFNLALQSAADYELILRLMLVNQIRTNYLTDVLVKMRAGGQSNRSISNRLRAHEEDRLAWKLNGIPLKWYTPWLKPARKVKQFLFPPTTLEAHDENNFPVNPLNKSISSYKKDSEIRVVY